MSAFALLQRMALHTMAILSYTLVLKARESQAQQRCVESIRVGSYPRNKGASM